MTVPQRLVPISDALIQKKSFEPFETDLLDDYGGGFVVTRLYWGTPVTIAAVLADDLTQDQLRQLADAHYALTVGQLQRFENPLHGTVVPKSSVGQLWLVFSRICDEGRLADARALKRRKLTTVLLPWVLDLPNRQVHFHKGLPFMRFPGRRFLQGLLRSL